MMRNFKGTRIVCRDVNERVFAQVVRRVDVMLPDFFEYTKSGLQLGNDASVKHEVVGSSSFPSNKRVKKDVVGLEVTVNLQRWQP